MTITTASNPAASLANHAVCVAAGMRDGLRIAQFFVRDLAGAEGWGRAPTGPKAPAFLTVALSRVSRLTDRVMTWCEDTAIALFAPDWRKLPSPFTRGMMSQVANAIGSASLVSNPLFNAYFYRAAIHILRRYRSPPFLVLEHRVDAARRMLAEEPAGAEESDAEFLASALIALVAAAPIARPGRALTQATSEPGIPPNVLVYATACVALLFAEEGRPAEELDEDQFFAVVGALIAPRLPAIADAVSAADDRRLARELLDIKAMY